MDKFCVLGRFQRIVMYDDLKRIVLQLTSAKFATMPGHRFYGDAFGFKFIPVNFALNRQIS